MNVEKSQAVLADLEHKLSGARERKVECEALIRDVSFGAHTGDVAARKSLDKAAADLARWNSEIASLEAAVEIAKKHVAAALADEADADKDERAREALVLLDAFAARGAALDAAFDAAIAEYTELARDFRKLDALGFAPTSYQLVKNNLTRAVATKLLFTDLRQDFLAPAQRVDFKTAIAGWAAHVKARATARLNQNKAAKAA